MTAPYIHGGTDEREIARLEKQAEWTASFTFPRFDAAPGMRVLDLACGTGAMASRLARWFPGTALVGVDLSSSQLAASRRNHPTVTVARADAGALPFADGTFDRVHCSWLLEHVREPVKVLREVRRVLVARRAGVSSSRSTTGRSPPGRCYATCTTCSRCSTRRRRGPVEIPPSA